MSSVSLNCPKGLLLNGEDGGNINISGGLGAGLVTVNGVLPIGTGNGDNHFPSVFIEDPVGDKSDAVILAQDTTSKDLEISTPATASIRFASGVDMESAKDIKTTSTDIMTAPQENPPGTISGIPVFTAEMRLFHDVMRSFSCYKFEMCLGAGAQAADISTSICMGTTEFTQYYAGKKTSTNSGTGDVKVPLRTLMNTAGMFTFELFNSGVAATAAEPTPPVPRPQTLNGTSFPASPAAGDRSGGPDGGNGGTATPGFLGLKITCPFIMPDFSDAADNSQNFVTLANSLSYNNRAGGWSDGVMTNPRIVFSGNRKGGGGAAGYDGQFTIGFHMPVDPVATINFQAPNNVIAPATNWAYMYVTYQPQLDLRQLD